MNYLELAQELREEAGVSGNDGTPLSVLNQTGELKRVVDWIAKAYEEVQDSHNNWDFLLNDFSFPTVNGQASYLLSGVAAIAELSRWKVETLRCYLTATGTNDEMFMSFVEWDSFRDIYMMSANRNVQGRPVKFTIRPNDKALLVWPAPSQPFTISGQFWMRPQVMALDADEPLFPREYHRVLVWRGLMYYGAFEAAPEAYAHGESEFNKKMAALEADQLAPIETAGPMA